MEMNNKLCHQHKNDRQHSEDRHRGFLFVCLFVLCTMENSSGPRREPYVTPFEIRRRFKNDPANSTDGLFSCDISGSNLS